MRPCVVCQKDKVGRDAMLNGCDHSVVARVGAWFDQDRTSTAAEILRSLRGVCAGKRVTGSGIADRRAWARAAGSRNVGCRIDREAVWIEVSPVADVVNLELPTAPELL